MSLSMCVYCEELPKDFRAHAARVMRCPLCHTEVGINASDAKFAVMEGEPAPETSTPRFGMGALARAWRSLFGGPAKEHSTTGVS